MRRYLPLLWLVPTFLILIASVQWSTREVIDQSTPPTAIQSMWLNSVKHHVATFDTTSQEWFGEASGETYECGRPGATTDPWMRGPNNTTHGAPSAVLGEYVTGIPIPVRSALLEVTWMCAGNTGAATACSVDVHTDGPGDSDQVLLGTFVGNLPGLNSTDTTLTIPENSIVSVQVRTGGVSKTDVQCLLRIAPADTIP